MLADYKFVSGSEFSTATGVRTLYIPAKPGCFHIQSGKNAMKERFPELARTLQEKVNIRQKVQPEHEPSQIQYGYGSSSARFLEIGGVDAQAQRPHSAGEAYDSHAGRR
jgi:hypothetical protein